VLLATYRLIAYMYSFGLHRYLIKKPDHNDKLSRLPKQRSAFVRFAKIVMHRSDFSNVKVVSLRPIITFMN